MVGWVKADKKNAKKDGFIKKTLQIFHFQKIYLVKLLI